MSRQALIGLTVGLALTACAGAFSVPSDSSFGFENVSIDDPRDLPNNFASREGRPGPNGGTLFDPISERLEHGIAYRFDLGHCGLHSPIDVDGSFWDPIDGLAAGGGTLDLAGDSEMINATAGSFVVIGDEARFRTESRSVIRLERHVGDKEFPGCD